MDEIRDCKCHIVHCALCEREGKDRAWGDDVRYEFCTDNDALNQRATLTLPGNDEGVKCSNFVVRAICILHRHLNKPVEKKLIAQFVWGGRTVGSNSLPVLVNDLRKVLKGSRYRIVTLRGVGYMMVEDVEPK